MLKRLTILTILILNVFSVVANPTHLRMRRIIISGLVLDANTLDPISNASIYRDNNVLLGRTDDKGYFKVKIEFKPAGVIRFAIKITKNGFSTFHQRENWGDLSGNLTCQYYFGLQQGSKSKAAFSKLLGSNAGATYETLLEGLGSFKDERSFDSQLNSAKRDNENVVITVRDHSYLVSKTGWLLLRSGQDKILLNGKSVMADSLNHLIKRNQIKKMSPAEKSSGYDFILLTTDD